MPNGAKIDQWVELESSKIAWPGTYTNSDKFETHNYFKELFKLIEPFGKDV